MSGPIRKALGPMRSRTIDLLNLTLPQYDPAPYEDRSYLEQVAEVNKILNLYVLNLEKLIQARESLVGKDAQWLALIPTLPAAVQKEEEERYGHQVELDDGHHALIAASETKISTYKAMIADLENLRDTLKHKDRLAAQSVAQVMAAVQQPPHTPPPVQPQPPTQLLEQLKLPKMEIPSFNGDPLQWSAFWDIWESTVHSARISDVQKLGYLMPKMTGDAANSLKGLSITSANYSEAIQILQKRFGDPTVVVNTIFAKIRGMKVSGTTVKELRSTYDCVGRYLRQLTALHEDIDQPLLADILKTKLPNEILVEMQRLKKLSDPWTVQFIRDSLFTVLVAKEEISRINIPTKSDISKEQSKPKGTSGSKGQSGSDSQVTTTGSLSAGTQQAPSKNQNRGKSRGKPASDQPSSTQASQGSTSSQKRQPKCVFCNGQHYSNICSVYPTVVDRRRCLMSIKDPVTCLRCLRQGHMSKDCKARIRCYHCKSEKHNTAFCLGQSGSNQAGTSSSSSQAAVSQESGDFGSTPSTSQQLTLQINPFQMGVNKAGSTNQSTTSSGFIKTSMLLTATSMVSNPANPRKIAKVQIFFDPGAQRTFVKQSLVEKLQLPCEASQDLLIYTFGSSQPAQRRTTRHVVVNLLLRNGKAFSMEADSVEHLTSPQKRMPLTPPDQQFIQASIPAAFFADDLPLMAMPFNPEIIVGEDYFWDFIVDSPRTILPSGMYCIPSKLGLLIGGKQLVENTSTSSANQALHVQCLMNQALDEINLFDSAPLSVSMPNLEDFWQLERIGITESPSVNADDDAVEQFNKSIQQVEGRYYVKWPLNDKIVDLPSNKTLSLRRFKSLTKRFSQEPELLPKYAQIIKDQQELGIIEPVYQDVDDGRQFHYLPHHPVITPQKATTKVRIVYDGSARTKFTQSINDCLLRGQVILPDLCGLLLRFRLRPIAIIADIEKAFLQVGLQDTDRDLTRFWWYVNPTIADASDSNLQIYRFCRVPFGIISSPFLLAATVKHHLQRYDNDVAELILSNIYVDNVIIGCDNVDKALDIYHRSKEMFREASMNLREWASNCSQFIQQLPERDRVEQPVLKVLGLLWDTQKDILIMTKPKIKNNLSTKREICQVISSIFDPLGFMSPSTLKGKLYLQQLWEQQLDWDDPLPEQLQLDFQPILADLQQAQSISMDRFIQVDSELPVELHVFIDASAKAYALAAYLRQSTGSGFRVNLIFAKVRLTPKQPKITIPRLELLAMLIGCRAIRFLHQHLSLNISASYIWSDSQCCLQWLITKRPLARFVQNRVSEIHNIQQNVPTLSFHFVRTQDNPADLATRGLSIPDLKSTQLWWHGPSWLSTDVWPQHHFPPVTDSVLKQMEEELCHSKSIPLYTATINLRSAKKSTKDTSHSIPNPMGIKIEKFSTLSRLLRVTATCLRFLKLCSKRDSGPFNGISTSGPLMKPDLQMAADYWDLNVQKHYFSDIFKSIKSNSDIPIVNQLGLQLNASGILTCHGRFQTANIFRGQFPILIPKQSHYTRLLILDRHNQVHHSGTQHTLSALRQTHWLPSGRSIVQATLKTCIICRKIQGGPYNLPKMAPYPTSRISRARPFQFTGIDYLGPLWYKNADGEKIKAYICLFTCLAIRAVHLELVTDMTAQMFLNCLRRFIARRGTPERILSDNAPTFLLTKAAIQRKWNDLITDDSIINYCSSKSIDWKTTTPMAPWQGGVYERLVGLTKMAFKKSIGHRLLSLEQLQTFVPEIESILNTRPLTYVYSDSNQVLRPVDFLIPQGSLGMPQFSEDPKDPDWKPKLDSSEKLVKFWDSTQRILDQFWNFWHQEYLASLLEQSQTEHQQPARRSPFFPKVDDVVLIKEDLIPRGSWKLGKIQQLHQSQDGHVRSANVQLPNQQVLTRPINHLFPVEVSANSTSVNGFNNSRRKRSPYRLSNFATFNTQLCVFLLLLTCSITSTFAFVPDLQLQLCSRGRSGHAIEVPITFSCHLPKNSPIEKMMVELWTQRDMPQRTGGFHCYIQLHTINTHTSFVGGKALVGEDTQYSSVLPSDCWAAIQTKKWPRFKLPLVELSPGFWSTNLSLVVEYRWCCYDHQNFITNFFIEEGEIASIDGKRLVSDLQDLSACNPTIGHCQNRDLGVTVWNGSVFNDQCAFQNKGKFIATLSGQAIIIDRIQGAFSYSGKPHVAGSECVPPSAKYTDQGAVYVHFLNSTPRSWDTLTNKAIETSNISVDPLNPFADLENYRRNFLYKKLLQVESKEFGMIWHQLCTIKQTQLNHVWQLLRIDPSLGVRALLGRDDLHAEWAGQALIFWECRNVTPAAIHWDGQMNSTCYKYTPVQLEHEGTLHFISPGSRDLVQYSPTVDCAQAPPHYFKDSSGQWHSGSGPVHITKIPMELSWKGLWSTFSFKAPSLFSNSLGHFSSFMDIQHQIHRMTHLETTIKRLVDYTSSMSLNPEVIRSAISGVGEGMAHIVEGNAKALGHLITGVSHGLSDLASGLLKGPLQLFINIIILLAIILGMGFVAYILIRSKLFRRAVQRLNPKRHRKSSNVNKESTVAIEMEELDSDEPTLPKLLYRP